MSAFIREWPDKEFIASVEEAFPDQGIANVEEARVHASLCSIWVHHSEVAHNSCTMAPDVSNLEDTLLAHTFDLMHVCVIMMTKRIKLL